MSNENSPVKFSIIIPLMVINDYVEETCGKLKQLSSHNHEIIIVANERTADTPADERRLNAVIIGAGDISPAIKRDIGAKQAKGKYLVFIDDDAYPDSDWLSTAEQHLDNEEIAAVGGPQLTPPHDTFWQKVSGAMYMSPLSGRAVIRYWPGKKTEEIEDWPTVNFIVKKDIFEAVGGFDSQYWPGEDTKLCLDIIKKTRKKMLYVPNMIVYHHRRSGFRKHLKQTGNYGLHRGYFARIFPETSRKLATLYFMPTLFVLFLAVGLILSFFYPLVKTIYFAGLVVYLAAILFSTLSLIPKTKSIAISIMTVPFMISFHIWYGIRFLQGFVFTNKLESKLGR